MTHNSSSAAVVGTGERAPRHRHVRREGDLPSAVCSPPTPPAFTIALSREAGANAPAVAQAVGERLGWPVYDRELVERIAAEMGLRGRVLEGIDEKAAGWPGEGLEELAAGVTVTQAGYVRHLKDTLLALAARGACVIVGRGAAQLLPAQATVRVRLVAPAGWRVALVGRHFGLSPEEAARWVETTDRQRTAFVTEHFGKDPTDLRQYDLVLNTGRFPVAACAEVIVDAVYGLQRCGAEK
jgi:cytidylate kinase